MGCEKRVKAQTIKFVECKRQFLLIEKQGSYSINRCRSGFGKKIHINQCPGVRQIYKKVPEELRYRGKQKEEKYEKTIYYICNRNNDCNMSECIWKWPLPSNRDQDRGSYIRQRDNLGAANSESKTSRNKGRIFENSLY